MTMSYGVLLHLTGGKRLRMRRSFGRIIKSAEAPLFRLQRQKICELLQEILHNCKALESMSQFLL